MVQLYYVWLFKLFSEPGEKGTWQPWVIAIADLIIVITIIFTRMHCGLCNFCRKNHTYIRPGIGNDGGIPISREDQSESPTIITLIN